MPVRGGPDVRCEFRDLLFERCDPFQLDVLLMTHLDQEGFHSRQTPPDRLHDGDDSRNSSTSKSVHLCHYAHSSRSDEPADVLFCTRPIGEPDESATCNMLSSR